MPLHSLLAPPSTTCACMDCPLCAEVLEHVRERSPLLIHCRFDMGGRADAGEPLAARLLADGCYCNGFEAAHRAAFSAASALHGAPADPLAARRAWEHDLFAGAQRGPRRWLPQALDGFLGRPAGLAAADRPRYGELNLFEAPGGTAAAAALYGRSYIELAACTELRQRWAARAEWHLWACRCFAPGPQARVEQGPCREGKVLRPTAAQGSALHSVLVGIIWDEKYP